MVALIDWPESGPSAFRWQELSYIATLKDGKWGVPVSPEVKEIDYGEYTAVWYTV